MSSFKKKLSGAAALVVTVGPLATGAVNAVIQGPQMVAYADEAVTVEAKSVIGDAQPKGQNGNTFGQSYDLTLKIPDKVKAGDKVTIETENLPLLFGDGKVASVDVKVDNQVIGKLNLVKQTNYRNNQIDTKTSLDQKKQGKIPAGSLSAMYELVFNDKAESLKNKEVNLKSSSESSVFTAVAKDTTVKSVVKVNGKEIASKDLTIKPSPQQSDKENKTTIDFSQNTQLTAAANGETRYFLALGVRPLDQDYGVGSKITINLPKDSMMKFVKADGDSKDISIIPAFNKDSAVNEAGVYLADVNPVKVGVAELTDNKLVLEVKEGTLKRVQYYVINSENTPVSYRLTDKSAGKLAADGKSFGPETLTSSITTPDGKVNATSVNTSSIKVNGAAITAKGVQELIDKPAPKPTEKQEFVTRWVKKEDGSPLKKEVTGDKILDPEKFDGYVLVETKQDGNTTTYVYEARKTVKTSWVEERTTKDKDGKESKETKPLKDSVTGDKTEPAGTFDGYDFVRTDTDKDGNVTHVFKKQEGKVTTSWVEEVIEKDKSGKEVKSEKKLKDPVTGDKTEPAGTFDGYEFVRSDKMEDGSVKHVFKKATKAGDKKDAVQTGGAAGKLILPVVGVGGVGGLLGAAAWFKSKKSKE